MIVAGFAAAVLALGTVCAAALPGPTACLLLGTVDLHVLPDGSLTNSEAPEDRARLPRLTRDARERIALKFGAPQARPILVYFKSPDGFASFTEKSKNQGSGLESEPPAIKLLYRSWCLICINSFREFAAFIGVIVVCNMTAAANPAVQLIHCGKP
jgi:hypothetical protein